MSAIALIPARGGSVRIPRKNIKPFHGKPIIAYSIETAKASGLFDRVIVSTDDDEIAEVAKSYGAEVMKRGPELSLEHIGPLDVACDALRKLAPVEIVGVIYATAPLMSVKDLIRGYREVTRPQMAYSVSIGTVPFLHDAAQFFFCKSWALQDGVMEFGEYTSLIHIDAERDCDINTPEDWDKAEAMYKEITCAL